MKFNIGDKLHISGDIKITGAHECGDGVYSYGTDNGTTFREPVLEKLVCKTESVEPQDKPKRKVGDRVKIIGGVYKGQTATIIKIDERDADVPYQVETDDGGTPWKHVTHIEPYTEPAKPEAVKLYCVKGYEPGHWCTKGKIYEIDADGGITHDDGWVEIDFLPFMRRGGCICDKGTEWKKYLVPLVPRPAKAGEWVLPPEDWCIDHHKERLAYKVMKYDGDYSLEIEGKSWYMLRSRKYLTLDGYDGRHEQTEPKYYSGDILCVKAHPDSVLKQGYKYHVKDGIFEYAPGSTYYNSPLASLKEINQNASPFAAFIEYKGEAT